MVAMVARHEYQSIAALRVLRAGRQNLEVDIVSLDSRTPKPRFAIEIKWSDAIVGQGKELHGLKNLAERHELARFFPLVATRTRSGELGLDASLSTSSPWLCIVIRSAEICCVLKFGETDVGGPSGI